MSDQPQASSSPNSDVGHLVMSGSKQQDNIWRNPGSSKEGDGPQNGVPPPNDKKGKSNAKAREEKNGTAGLSSAILRMKIDTFDSRRLQPAYHIPGLDPDTPPVGQETKPKNAKKKKKGNGNLSNSAVMNSCQHYLDLPKASESQDLVALVATDPVKKLRNLRKKLRDIEILEKKLENGEIGKPEPEQLEKVARKIDVQEEIANLEKATS